MDARAKYLKREDLILLALSLASDHKLSAPRLQIAVFLLQEELKDYIEGPLYEFEDLPDDDPFWEEATE